MASIKSKPPKYRIEQFYAIRQLFGLSVSPDNKTVAYITNTNGMPNIWTIPIEGGWTTQVTLEQNAVRSLVYSEKKNEIIFQSDVNGDENQQIFIVNDKGGIPENLSPSHAGSQAYFIDWDKSSNKFLFASNKRDKRFFDSYIYDMKTGKEECIYESCSVHVEIPGAWSQNERYLLFNVFYHNSNHDIFIYDRQTKVKKNITSHEGDMYNASGRFNKQNDIIYFITNNGKEFNYICQYKIKTGEYSNTAVEKWDIVSYKLSESNKFLVYQINEDGSYKTKIKYLKTGKTITLNLPKGTCLDYEITPNEKSIIFLLDGPQNPNDIYIYDLQKKKLKQITFSMIGGIPKEHFTVPKVITYKSFDGLEISATLFIPSWMKKNGKNPAIVWPHGGPEAQISVFFSKYFQIFTNLGFIVIAPNFRGSTGYGKSFQKKIYKDWGGAEFKDVLGSYDYLLKCGYVDAAKIAVVGGSFGGFMTLTCVTKAPELWKCAVDIFGPSNLFTFLNSIPEHWKPASYELVGDPEKDKEMLTERSPINYVDNIVCPLFIVQGKNDPRVVQKESDQIVEKLRSKNKEVEYMVLEDEGHGFSKVSNQIKVWSAISEFLEKHMR
ncbi:MAG: S9 family peptidase [Ignavibacteriae bacterium]|nr:MAG: S9 family peptidase [Ignavibacteriota bacterium]